MQTKSSQTNASAATTAQAEITVEIWSTWNNHNAQAGVAELLDIPTDKGNTKTPWARYRIHSIEQFSGCNGMYFSVRRGSVGAHAVQNVRNLRVNGKLVELPEYKSGMISEYTVTQESKPYQAVRTQCAGTGKWVEWVAGLRAGNSRRMSPNYRMQCPDCNRVFTVGRGTSAKIPSH